MAAERGIVSHRRDAMGYGLAALHRIAGSKVIDRLGMRKPTERVVFEATKTGFRTLGAVNRTFVKKRGGRAPHRTKPGRQSGVFDLTPTDDQQLMLIGLSREAAALIGQLQGTELWRSPALAGALQPDPASGRDRFTLVAKLALPTPATAPEEAGNDAPDAAR